MKIALVHDYVKEIGGAERVLMALHDMWPEAPVYTAYKFPEYWGYFKEELAKWDIRESWGAWLPLLPKFISYYTAISPLFFSEMDLSEYDVVIISATGGYFPNGVHVGPETKVITYCHTPPRFLYGYETATKTRHKWYWKPISDIANHFLRMVDFYFAQKPTAFVANSKNVANRIRKFYRRESEVIYPPIDVPQSGKKYEKEDYYLIISRIVGTKNIELGVTAANKYGFKLKIAGRAIGKSGDEIVRKITGSNVEYLGEVSEEERDKLLSQAKGFLALEREADFGMTTVEPMAYGTPAIAYRAGGYLETVVDGKTGVFFDELTVDGVGRAVERFEKIKWDAKLLQKHAAKFSKKRFMEEIERIIEKTVRV